MTASLYLRLDTGADIVTIAKLAGHASPSTTSKYDRRGEAAKKWAVGLLNVPYQKRKNRARTPLRKNRYMCSWR